MKKIIKYRGFELEYLEITNSREKDFNKITLAFHGFGKSAEDFLIFEPQLQSNEVIYSFNLLHHGNSTAPKQRLWKNNLQPDEFKSMIEHILKVLKIEKFSLLAYSMGGRISLKIVELIPDKISKITLIAPDGLKRNYYYPFVTKTWVGRTIFKRFIKNPQPIFLLIAWLTKLKIINKSIDKIVKQSTRTLDQRNQVGNTWFMYSAIFFEQQLVQELISKNQIPILLIYGKYDKLIPPRQGLDFLNPKDHSKILILEKGHKLMINDTAFHPKVVKHLSI